MAGILSRFGAEWPLVECVVRARFDVDRITECGLGLGGGATVPLRIGPAESILTGATLTDEIVERAAATCTRGASPLPETGYKLDLVAATVRESLERLRRI